MTEGQSPNRRTATFFSLAAGATFTAFLFLTPYDFVNRAEPWVRVAAIAAPLLFLLALLISFYHPAVEHVSGLLAAILALSVLVETETLARLTNSWITLNQPGNDVEGYIRLALVKVIATGFVLAAGLISALRLLPRRWSFRSVPMANYTWPPITLSFLILAAWFGRSVLPYRVPIIVDAQPAEITFLHVEKHGFQFHETTISVYRDSRFFVWHNDRRQLHYSFRETTSWGVLPRDLFVRVTDVINSPELEQLKTPAPERLTHWNAEGWYVAIPHSRIMSFSSEHHTEPPRNVVDLFHAIQQIPLSSSQEGIARDVCLGFCYDPPAGLGFRYINQRCRTDQEGTTRCL